MKSPLRPMDLDRHPEPGGQPAPPRSAHGLAPDPAAAARAAPGFASDVTVAAGSEQGPASDPAAAARSAHGLVAGASVAAGSEHGLAWDPAAVNRSAPSQPRPAVLLVDDDRRNRTLLADYLEGAYEVHEAGNGREALSTLERERIDLVLLDVMMPEMSGFDTCRAIRQTGIEGFLPVILLTALSEQEDRNAGLAAGADDFLTKPVDRRELLLRVSAFLKMRQQDALIRKQLEDLRRMEALKDDLISLIVHDVRNPLMGVQGFLELLQRKLAKSSQMDVRTFIQKACESCARLREILEDMLDVRLLEQGKFSMDRQPVMLGGLVADAVATLEGAATASNVGIRLAVVSDASAHVDPKLVRRCVENLLANAVKYSPPGLAIDVTVSRVEGRSEVQIADRGPGIPDPLKKEVFERFCSVEAKQETVRRGFGLGLFLVKLVMEAHGGDVSVRDREGGGSIFAIAFPG